MKPRFDFATATPKAYGAIAPVDDYLEQASIEPTLLHLVRLRASQINGCAYCIDMHWKDLRALGEEERRLYGLDAWRESPYYSDRERAGLAWTEALTLVSRDQVPNVVYDEVKPHFNETELADLTIAIGQINFWNRVAIASRMTPGHYRSTLQPAEEAHAAV
jgi:AhpD family alkylhydroperoxidase